MRKVEGGLRALSTWVEQSKSDFLVQNRLTYADIAICSVLGFMNVRWPQHDWASLPRAWDFLFFFLMWALTVIAVNLTPRALHLNVPALLDSISRSVDVLAVMLLQ